MYSPDKMMNGKAHGPLHPTSIAPAPCFPGRYSPTYRGQDPMRRCVANPSVSTRRAGPRYPGLGTRAEVEGA